MLRCHFGTLPPKHPISSPEGRLCTAERPFLHPTRAGKAGSQLYFRMGRATGPCVASRKPCGYAHWLQPACCHVAHRHMCPAARGTTPQKNTAASIFISWGVCLTMCNVVGKPGATDFFYLVAKFLLGPPIFMPVQVQLTGFGLPSVAQRSLSP